MRGYIPRYTCMLTGASVCRCCQKCSGICE